jgi:phospholipid/cholesterol/gamma-HCH transport system substrate-binding protein
LSRQIRAGLVAILAFAMLYWGINFLKGKNLFNSQTLVYSIYERVDGLTPARPVTINGFQIGQVNRIYFHPNKDGRLIVEMSINTDFTIPKSSIARINSTSLMGDKSVELILANDYSNILEDGDTLNSEIMLSLTEEVNRQVLPLKQKAESLIGSIDTAMTLVTSFLNDQTRNNFIATFASVRRSFETLENTTKEIDLLVTDNRVNLTRLIENITSISKGLKDNESNLSAIIANAESISDTIAKANIGETLRSLNTALSQSEEIFKKVNDGTGTAGKLINDPKLYDDMAKAAEQLNLLLLDVKYNPNRYIHFSVFGSSKEYDKEEMDKIIEQELKSK